LQDYVKMIHAVKIALQRRHEKRVSFSACLTEVDSKATQLAKLRGQMGQEAKAYSTEMSLRRAQEAADAAQHEFATVSQRVLREVDRFKRDKAVEMRFVVLNYIQLQVAYNKRMEQAWAILIPQLERVQLDPEITSSPSSMSPGDKNSSYPGMHASMPQSDPSRMQSGNPILQQPQNQSQPPSNANLYMSQSYSPHANVLQYSNVAAPSSTVQQAPPVWPGNDGTISVQYRE
jgi:hypothetical protein